MILRRDFEIGLAERRESKGGPKVYPSILTTGSPIKREIYWGQYMETLSMKPGAIDLSRVPIPLLTSHDRSSLPIGLVKNVHIDGNDLRGDVVFGNSERAREVQADVDDGIVRSLSIGYGRDKIKETRDRKTGHLTAIYALRWTLYEVSAVSVPAVPEAGFNRTLGDPMDPELLAELNLPPDATPEQVAAAIRDLRGRAIDNVRTLALQRGLFRPGGDRDRLFSAALERSAEEADALAATWASSPEVPVGADPVTGRSLLQTARATVPRMPGSPPVMSYPHVSASRGGDDFREAAVDAILLRAGVEVPEPHPAAGDVDASPAGLARMCLSRAGQTVHSHEPSMLVRAAGASTSDYPLLLADSASKAAMLGFENEPASHRRWVRAVPVKDFKPTRRALLGVVPTPSKVLEGGEAPHVYLDEEGTNYSIAKYEMIVALLWETMINDDLGQFMRALPGMGQAVRRLESDLVYAVLAANPTMQDGNPLFDSGNHANVASTAALSKTTLGEARALLRKQTPVGGVGYLNLQPRYLIVPAELETEAEIILATATKHITSSPSTEAMTPKWIAGLELVVEPRVASNVCYLAASNQQIDTIELGRLPENMNGPYLQREEAFDVDAMRWKCRSTAGVKALNWRGLIKMPQS